VNTLNQQYIDQLSQNIRYFSISDSITILFYSFMLPEMLACAFLLHFISFFYIFTWETLYHL